MKTVRIQTTETLRYDRTMEFRVIGKVEDAEIEKAIDWVERRAESTSEVPYLLEKKLGLNIRIISSDCDDYSSPNNLDVVIDSLEIEGEE